MGFVSTTPSGYPVNGTMLTQYPYISSTMNQQATSAQMSAAGNGSFGSGFAEAMTVAGPLISIFGAVNSAVGSYYSAKSQQNQLEMQSQNQRFAADMARINQRGAEFTARQIGEEGQKRFGAYSMRAGQQRAGAKASLAARGIVLGTGSAGEIMGSMDLVKEIDRLNMNAATVRAQEAAKLQAFNLGTQAMMGDLSANNLSTTAGTIYPGLAAGTSLLGSATDIATTWARNRRIEEFLTGVSSTRM